MNLNPRVTEYVSRKEILANTAGSARRAVTLDGKKFSGIVEAGTALSIDPTTKKAKPWEDTDTGEAVLLEQTVIVKDSQDVISVALEAGIVFEYKCTGVTEAFKDACKLIKFR